MASPGSIDRWHDEADVVVLGIGLSGCVAAIEAHDADPQADVLIVEKMHLEQAGGNSRVSGQTIFCPHGLEALRAYQRALSEPNVPPEDVMEAFTEALATQEPWIERMAAEVGREYTRSQPTLDVSVAEVPEFPGSECFRYDATIIPGPSAVWRTFMEHVERRDIRIRYGTRAVDLVQDPDSLEVIGVICESADGRVAIRARRAIVVCTGGFAASPQLIRDYLGVGEAYTMGTPANTGDGLRMLQKAGADLWHLRNRNQTSGFFPAVKVPDFEIPFVRNMAIGGRSWIDVACDSRRFYDEGANYRVNHFRQKANGHWGDVPHPFVLPVHMIFDETVRTSDQLCTHHIGWNPIVEGYLWSADNAVELDRGWIVQAGSIRELAARIDRSPEALAVEVERFNAAARQGRDADFGRDPATMRPIERPPYYALALVPALPSTTGGPRRNGRAQVIGHDGAPIERLYEAGELGSVLSNLFQRGSHLAECIAFGRIAGRNAVAEPRREPASEPQTRARA